MKLGTALKELADRSPHSVKAIATKAEITRTSFYDCVRERFTPSAEVLGRILDALEVDDKVRATLMSLRDARDKKLLKAQNQQFESSGYFIKAISEKLTELGFAVSSGGMSSADLIVSTGRGNVAVEFKFKIPDHHRQLGILLDSMGRDTCVKAFVVLPFLLKRDDPFVRLFDKSGAGIVTLDGLLCELEQMRPGKNMK